MPGANIGLELNREQVLTALDDRYFNMLPTRFPNRPLEDQQKDRFSRALAAFAIQKLSDCSDIDAVAAIVDCGDDNGIDAIHYDRRQNILWLIQSKYGDAPDRGSNQAFCTGITDLLNEQYDRFRQTSNNPEFTRIQPDVEEALAEPLSKVAACVVYLGNPLGLHAIGDLNQLKTSQNGLKNWFDWHQIGLPELHGWLTAEQVIPAIDVNLTLENWNYFTNPRRAVYGLVNASQLNTLYQQHGNALFQRNIRHYLGNQSVNLAITETVQGQPVELFYLNNGLTIICSQFGYTGNQNHAVFSLRNFSIVNGAQTVGSIGQAGVNGEISNDAKLMLTVLELGDDDGAHDMGTRITRARNTQTAVNRDNFAALDPNQERLRQELAISDVIYHYRPSAEIIANDDNQFTLGDATRALACLIGDTAMIVALKKEISLVTDRNGQYYARLFRNNLTGASLYRRVQVYRYIETDLLQPTEKTEQGRRLIFFKHSHYFIMHIWARRNQPMLNRSELILSESDKLEISRQVLDLAEEIFSVAEAMFAADDKGYLKIFRNLTDAEQLARGVMQHLNQPNMDD
jgi:hypothetical protein